MRNDTLLFLQKIECPVCKAINEYETIKIGAYEEQGRDSDFCPTNIKWSNPKYQKFNPILFFMATCSNCYYTREYTSKFKDWKNDTTFRTYRLKTMKARHTEHLAQESSIIRTLGERLHSDKYPLQTAINKLLLGIYDEMLLDKPSNLDIARYFLRIGWLFRECTSSESGGHDIHLSFVAKLEKDVKTLNEVSMRLSEVRTRLKSSIHSFLEDASFTTDAVATELNEKCQQAMAFLAGANEQFESAMSNFSNAIRISSDSIVCVSDNDAFAMPYAGSKSYRDFLKELRYKWEFIPVSEHEALRLAMEFYKAAYETGYEVSAGNQQIQVEYLLGELCRRLCRNEEAKKYFNNTIRSAQEFIYQYKGDNARTALARKILDMAMTQGKLNIKETKVAES